MSIEYEESIKFKSQKNISIYLDCLDEGKSISIERKHSETKKTKNSKSSSPSSKALKALDAESEQGRLTRNTKNLQSVSSNSSSESGKIDLADLLANEFKNTKKAMIGRLNAKTPKARPSSS